MYRASTYLGNLFDTGRSGSVGLEDHIRGIVSYQHWRAPVGANRESAGVPLLRPQITYDAVVDGGLRSRPGALFLEHAPEVARGRGRRQKPNDENGDKTDHGRIR